MGRKVLLFTNRFPQTHVHAHMLKRVFHVCFSYKNRGCSVQPGDTCSCKFAYTHMFTHMHMQVHECINTHPNAHI